MLPPATATGRRLAMRASQQDEAEDEKDDAGIDKGALAGNADSQQSRSDCDKRLSRVST